MLLADLGADVIRIDRPGGLGGPADGEILNRGRRSIVLNLKDPGDLDVARRLLVGADVAVDPYRPGAAERLGIGPQEMLARNPRLVFARMTGWGQTGPLSGAPGHDINFAALAGAIEPLGDGRDVPPVPLNMLADHGGGGMLLAFGVLAALVERARSGEGQIIDVAMVDGVASLLASVFHLRGVGQWARSRGSNWLQGAAPWYRAYRTRDGGLVTVGALEPQFYAELMERLGLPVAQRPQWDISRWPTVAEELTEVFASRSLEEWRVELEGTDACFAVAPSPFDAPDHPHLRARGTFVSRDGHVQPAPVPRFDRTPGALSLPPPRAGEHSEEIRAELDELG